MIPYVSVTDTMDKIKSPLLRELERAKQAELAALAKDSRPFISVTCSVTKIEDLDDVREDEKPKKKRRRHGLKMIQGGKKELK